MILSCGFNSAVYTWKLAGEPDRGCTFTVDVEIGHELKKFGERAATLITETSLETKHKY